MVYADVRGTPAGPQISETLKQRLYDEYQVEVPMVSWNGQKFIRVSFQGYNTPGDADTLVAALERLLPAAPS